MKRTALLLSLVFLLAACTKDSTKDSPPAATTGTIRFNNTSKNPYTVYVDGVNKGTMQGSSFSDLTVSAGTHTTEEVQVSGYVLYPTDDKGSVTVAAGGTVSVVFP